MGFMRNLAAAGGVSAMLAQDRDRLACEPAYLSYLREAFGQHGSKLRALNDRGDDSSEGQLTGTILDQIARFERLKIAEGSRRGQRSSKSRTISLSHVVKLMGNDASRKIRHAQSS